jgi:hypothetical protein
VLPPILEEEAEGVPLRSHTDEEHRVLPDEPALGGSCVHKFSTSAEVGPHLELRKKDRPVLSEKLSVDGIYRFIIENSAVV